MSYILIKTQGNTKIDKQKNIIWYVTNKIETIGWMNLSANIYID